MYRALALTTLLVVAGCSKPEEIVKPEQKVSPVTPTASVPAPATVAAPVAAPVAVPIDNSLALPLSSGEIIAELQKQGFAFDRQPPSQGAETTAFVCREAAASLLFAEQQGKTRSLEIVLTGESDELSRRRMANLTSAVGGLLLKLSPAETSHALSQAIEEAAATMKRGEYKHQFYAVQSGGVIAKVVPLPKVGASVLFMPDPQAHQWK